MLHARKVLNDILQPMHRTHVISSECYVFIARCSMSFTPILSASGIANLSPVPFIVFGIGYYGLVLVSMGQY